MRISLEKLDGARRVRGFRVTHRRALNIPICGEKDPRGPDNNIIVYIDDEGLLHIQVQKTDRCYRFFAVEETNSYIEVIAK